MLCYANEASSEPEQANIGLPGRISGTNKVGCLCCGATDITDYGQTASVSLKSELSTHRFVLCGQPLHFFVMGVGGPQDCWQVLSLGQAHRRFPDGCLCLLGSKAIGFGADPHWAPLCTALSFPSTMTTSQLPPFSNISCVFPSRMFWASHQQPVCRFLNAQERRSASML